MCCHVQSTWGHCCCCAMGLAWLRGFFREGDNAGQSNARDARHPDRMLRDKQSRNPIPRRKGPCQDDDGGQNLYSDAPRFFDPADLASIRLIMNSQHEVSLLKGSDAVMLGSTAGGPSSAKMQFAACVGMLQAAAWRCWRNFTKNVVELRAVITSLTGQ